MPTEPSIVPTEWFDGIASRGMPMHAAIVEVLWNAIDRGDLHPGDLLEPEVSLARRLGVSRSTVNRAMQTLREQGLIERRRSLGSRVVGRANDVDGSRLPINKSNPRVHGASESEFTERALRVAEIDPTPEIRQALDLRAGGRVTFVRRLVLHGRKPVAILQNWVPASILPAATVDPRGESVYALLAAAGHDVARARQWMTAEAAQVDTALTLGVPRGFALLTATRTSYSEDGGVLEYAEHKYRPDTYRVELDITRPG